MPPVPKRLEAFGNTKSPRTFESEEMMGGEGGEERMEFVDRGTIADTMALGTSRLAAFQLAGM